MKPILTVLLLLAALQVVRAAQGWAFAEGYSSASPGASAEVHYRAFTLYTGLEACRRSTMVSNLRVRLRDPDIRVGTRIHRFTTQTTVPPDVNPLIIEAYDAAGRFVPSAPVNLQVDALPDVVASRSDWDYLEIQGPGELQIRVNAICTGEQSVVAILRATIS